MTKFYPVYYNKKETNVKVSKCGLVKRVRKEWCKTINVGIVDFYNLKPHKNGYLSLTITIKDLGHKHILAHQLIASAFLGYEFGGNLVVDHIDNDKTNNSLNNLQLVTHRENILRSFIGNTIHPQGVYFDSSKNLYRARIQVNKKKISLGYFKDPFKASDVYFNYIKSLPC